MTSNQVAFHPVSSLGFGLFHYFKKNPLNSITKQVRDSIKPYEESNYIRAWQSVADSTNLFFTSCCNLYFSYRDAYNQSSTILDPQAFQLSNREFHDAEHTPGGFVTILGLGLTLVSFSLIASLSDKNDETSHWIFRWMNFLLPYVRIFLKQIKWVYKGIRYIFSILVQFGCQKEFLIHVLFPLVLVMAIASVINRMWQRRMQDTRKEMQRANIKLSEQIILSKTLVHQLEKLPESYQDYRCSFIFLKLSEETRLYYIDNLGVEKELACAEILYEKCQQVRTKNIHEIMLHHLAYLKGTTSKAISLNLYDGSFDEDFLRSQSQYRESYIYFTNTRCHEQQRLCYIDATGNIIYDKDSVTFDERYQKVAKQQTFSSIKKEQLLELNEVRALERELPAFQLGHRQNYFEFVDKYRTMQEIPEQDPWIARMGFFSAAMGGFFDGLYFYMGTVTLAIFTPHAYMILLALSFGLLVTCMMVRVYEEYVYQQRHMLTCIQLKLEFSREACRLLLEQSDFERISIDKSMVTQTNETAQKSILKELYSTLDEVKSLKELQKEIIKGSSMTACLGGLWKGLAVQGVIASAMFVSVTLFYGTLACPPMFIMGCLMVGIVAIVVCCFQASMQYQAWRNAFNSEDEQFTDEYAKLMKRYEECQSKSEPPSDIELIQILKEVKELLDRMCFDSSSDNMIVEWCEVWRLFLTGLSKGNKASFELFYNGLKQYDELWLMPIILFVSAICFAIAFSLNYMAKNFASAPLNYVDISAKDEQAPVCHYEDNPKDIASPSACLGQNKYLLYQETPKESSMSCVDLDDIIVSPDSCARSWTPQLTS